MGTKLFGRTAEVIVQNVNVSALRVSFTCQKSLKREPNKAEIKVWNLSENTRKAFEEASAATIQIKAGYGSDMSQIFRGNLRDIRTAPEGPDIITTFSAGDGLRAIRAARAARSFGPGTKLIEVFQGLVDSMGVGVGNVAEVAREARLRNGSDTYEDGTLIFGSAADELEGICRSTGLEWSIQDERLQLLQRGRALQSQALRLTAGSGLIGSPSISSKGVMQATCNLIPDLFPGRKVLIDSQFVRGVYRVERAQYVGDTGGAEWMIKIEGKREELE